MLREVSRGERRALATVLSNPTARRVGRIAAHTATVVLMLSVPAAAYADTATPVDLAAKSLPEVGRWPNLRLALA